MAKKIILFVIIWCVTLNSIGISYALSPPNVDGVEISGEDSIELQVGDTITLEATAIPNGVDYAYMTWITDVDGIVEINGEYDKRLLPPVGTVDITALSAGVVEVIVCANLEATAPEVGIDECSDATDRITITVYENITSPQKYEIWNNGEYTGVPPLLAYGDGYIKPVVYININDISKLGLRVEDTKGGIIVSNNTKNIKVMFDSKVLNIDSYSFQTPVINVSEKHFLMLDIIGKCFSDGYGGRAVDDIWRIYLKVDPVSDNVPSISVESILFNFEYDIYTIQIKNTSYYDADNAKIYTAYYSKDGTLLDLKISNIYLLKAKEEMTTFMPISKFFNTAAKCKIMLWNDKMQPIGEVETIKNFVYDKNMVVPENKEIIFTDIPANHKYYEAIYIMHNQDLNVGMFNGYEDGTYRPDDYVLKSEFAYSISKIIGMQLEKINVDYNLKDVSSSHWCKNAIGFLVSNNIMDTKNEYFYPNNEVTLNEVLTAFLRILGEKNITTDTIIRLANQHNLLINANTEELEITRGNYSQIAYNFMNEYCIKGMAYIETPEKYL